MSEKKIDKVCIDCINANEHLKISSDFKVSVEYGTCDCCGKRYIVVPFRRFFSENIRITPCTADEIPVADGLVKDNRVYSATKDISDLHERCNSISDDINVLRKAKVECTEINAVRGEIEKLQTQVKEMLEKLSAIELSGGEETIAMKKALVGDIIEPEKQQKPSKQKDINKAYE